MHSERRWMKWVLAESAKPGVALPWQRGTRRIADRTRRVATAAE
ncbi:MAG: hypothetical protein R3E00_14565 [Paracoccaceae bacterium]